MSFQFRLQSVLKLRQHERDVQRQLFAAASDLRTAKIAERNWLMEDRIAVLNELRSMNDDHSWPVAQVVHRQRHAEQLLRELAIAEADVVEADAQLEICLNRLILADRAVRGLERLEERQLADYQITQARIESQEFDDIAMSQFRPSN